jgi:putative transposase
MRDELLNKEMFANLKEAKVLAEEYREHYNHHWPHGALGYLSPTEFAATKALKAPEPSEQLESIQRLSL